GRRAPGARAGARVGPRVGHSARVHPPRGPVRALPGRPALAGGRDPDRARSPPRHCAARVDGDGRSRREPHLTLFLLLSGVGVLMLLRVPVAFSLLIPSLVYIATAKGITFTIVLQRMTSGIDSFPLLAVPLFIFMGNVANQAGITDRLFNFAQVALGHIRGSLGYVNVAASVLFSWM